MGRYFRYKFCDANLKKISPEVIFDDDFLGPLKCLKKELQHDAVKNEHLDPDEIDYYYKLDKVIDKIKTLGANYDAFELLSINIALQSIFELCSNINKFNYYDCTDEMLVDLYQISILISAALRHNSMYDPNDSDNIITYITFKYCQ